MYKRQSLGCDKNLVDSEKMLGLLNEAGYRVAQEESEADAIVVNTCCFIHDAKEESIETILEMAEWKKKGDLRALIVTGCMAQRYQDEIQQEIPEVDAVIGTTGYTEIVSILDEILDRTESLQEISPEEAVTQEKSFINCCPSIDLLPDSLADKRVVTTGGYTAYLKIAEGCNKRCTYCIIPYIRGQYRSFPMEDLLQEAKNLASNGVKELILIAQETTVYGMDCYGRKALPELLTKLCEIEGIEWIRILYCYPEEITDELIAVMKKEKKICHYLDIPIQHSEDTILKLSLIHIYTGVTKSRIERMMLRQGMMVKDLGTILVGEMAVKEGLIHEVGGISEALFWLHQEIERRRKRRNYKN